jgi:Ala-tRNA(Pro) deacylase
MIPTSIIEYLKRNEVPFKRRPHAQAVSSQQLAASLHVSGYRVAKSVIVDADGQKWIAVLPASETVNVARLAEVLEARKVRLLGESEFAPIFTDCEIGAEPPFGGLFGIPVVVDSWLADATWIILRAGSHQESLEMAYSDFVSLEKPRVGSFGLQPGWTETDHQRESKEWRGQERLR